MKHKKLSEYCTITCSPDWFKSMAVNTGYVGGPTTTGYLIPAADADAMYAVVEAAREAASDMSLRRCSQSIYDEYYHIDEDDGDKLINALAALDGGEDVRDPNACNCPRCGGIDVEKYYKEDSDEAQKAD